MTSYEEIITTLAAARRQRCISLLAASQAADSGSASAVSYWERGEKMPGLANAIAWAEGLGYELRLMPIGARRTNTHLNTDPDIARETAVKRLEDV